LVSGSFSRDFVEVFMESGCRELRKYESSKSFTISSGTPEKMRNNK